MKLGRRRMNIHIADSEIVSQEAQASVIQETIKEHRKTSQYTIMQ